VICIAGKILEFGVNFGARFQSDGKLESWIVMGWVHEITRVFGFDWCILCVLRSEGSMCNEHYVNMIGSRLSNLSRLPAEHPNPQNQ
jgi:hypothetical protein